LSRHMMFYSVN